MVGVGRRPRPLAKGQGLEFRQNVYFLNTSGVVNRVARGTGVFDSIGSEFRTTNAGTVEVGGGVTVLDRKREMSSVEGNGPHAMARDTTMVRSTSKALDFQHQILALVSAFHIRQKP